MIRFLDRSVRFGSWIESVAGSIRLVTTRNQIPVAIELASRVWRPISDSILHTSMCLTTLCGERRRQLMGKACRRKKHLCVFRGWEDGAALVEFAIVLPLLLIVVFGIISFGLIFNDKLSLTDGAREAGRFGATLPVTNFASPGDPMQQWLDAIASRAVADAAGSLDAGVPNRTICVAYVHPLGTAGVDKTRQRFESGGVVVYPFEPCFDDGRPDDERRVQVRVGRDTDLEAIFFSSTITLTADSVTRFEASLVAS